MTVLLILGAVLGIAFTAVAIYVGSKRPVEKTTTHGSSEVRADETRGFVIDCRTGERHYFDKSAGSRTRTR